MATLSNNPAFVACKAGNLEQVRTYQRRALEAARASRGMLAIVVHQTILDKDEQRLLAAKTTVDTSNCRRRRGRNRPGH
ncbi:MAG TPA: hypothetical protein VGF67_08005 [Ktedonobacteraceae bacterium]